MMSCRTIASQATAKRFKGFLGVFPCFSGGGGGGKGRGSSRVFVKRWGLGSSRKLDFYASVYMTYFRKIDPSGACLQFYGGFF